MSIIKREEIPEILRSYEEAIFVVNILSHKWALMLILVLNNPMKFGELRRSLGISHSVLSKELNYLEKLHMLRRNVFTEFNPPAVEYSLSEHGRALREVCMEMQKFGSTMVGLFPEEPPENIYK